MLVFLRQCETRIVVRSENGVLDAFEVSSASHFSCSILADDFGFGPIKIIIL